MQKSFGRRYFTTKSKRSGFNWIVESAGTNGFHTGEPPHHLSQKVSLLNGIDISHQKSRKFIATDINNYDIIYAMANDVLIDIKRISGNHFNSQKVILFLNEIFVNQNADVPDPWYGEEDGYHEVFELIDKTCEYHY